MQNSETNLEVKLSEEDTAKFKVWLKGHLSMGPVTVKFTKKDGTERVMKCTTAESLVPQVPVLTEEAAVPKKEKKKNEEVMSVYDLEAEGWRSFRWDSIKSVELRIGD